MIAPVNRERMHIPPQMGGYPACGWLQRFETSRQPLSPH
jgi:hypothetical protein